MNDLSMQVSISSFIHVLRTQISTNFFLFCYPAHHANESKFFPFRVDTFQKIGKTILYELSPPKACLFPSNKKAGCVSYKAKGG